MTTRRPYLLLLPWLALAGTPPLERLEGRWRSRITVVRAGRATYARLRFTFGKEGEFVLEEYALGGALAWIYRGQAKLAADQEFTLDVRTVSDPNGTAAEPGRARYEAGESYSLGVLEELQPTRFRIGGLELQKELD